MPKCQMIIDVVAQLRKHPDDEVRARAADEIEKLRGVIVRNCKLLPDASDGDRAIIESLLIQATKISN